MGTRGLSDRELIPRRGTTHDLQGRNGFSSKFKRDAAGVATEAAFHQHDTTLILKKKEAAKLSTEAGGFRKPRS
jgi:hypothetical protein